MPARLQFLVSKFFVLLLASASQAMANPATTSAMSALLDKRQELLVSGTPVYPGVPTYVESQGTSDWAQADVYGEVDHPVSEIARVLSSTASVCRMMVLHLFVQRCVPGSDAAGATLQVVAGTAGRWPNTQQTMTYRVSAMATQADFTNLQLVAKDGPLGTSDYRITIEAVALANQRSWVHMHYSYRFGTMARLAMNAYQVASGRTKIGFTVLGRDSEGKPQYVQGERGSLERNVMRTYLSLVASLVENSGTPSQQLESRQRAWYAMAEKYAQQLHELSLEEYLAAKRAALGAGLE
jgi:hypothetical protein